MKKRELVKLPAWIKEIEKRKEAIGKERDKLRELIEEADELSECCDETIELLEDAANKLSELV